MFAFKNYYYLYIENTKILNLNSIKKTQRTIPGRAPRGYLDKVLKALMGYLKLLEPSSGRLGALLVPLGSSWAVLENFWESMASAKKAGYAIPFFGRPPSLGKRIIHLDELGIRRDPHPQIRRGTQKHGITYIRPQIHWCH